MIFEPVLCFRGSEILIFIVQTQGVRPFGIGAVLRNITFTKVPSDCVYVPGVSVYVQGVLVTVCMCQVCL